MGLVDKLVRTRDGLRWECRKAILAEPHQPGSRLRQARFRARADAWLHRQKMREEVAKKARPEHFPAPYSLIELFEEHGNDWRAMKEGEIERFVPLLNSDTSRNLRRVFFLVREPQEARACAARRSRCSGACIVIGAGVMGGDIAACVRCAAWA